MYVCMYVCMYVYFKGYECMRSVSMIREQQMYVCMYVCLYWMNVCTICIYCLYVYMNVLIGQIIWNVLCHSSNVCMYVCMYVCIRFVCMYVCIRFVCMYVCMYVPAESGGSWRVGLGTERSRWAACSESESQLATCCSFQNLPQSLPYIHTSLKVMLTYWCRRYSIKRICTYLHTYIHACIHTH